MATIADKPTFLPNPDPGTQPQPGYLPLLRYDKDNIHSGRPVAQVRLRRLRRMAGHTHDCAELFAIAGTAPTRILCHCPGADPRPCQPLRLGHGPWMVRLPEGVGTVGPALSVTYTLTALSRALPVAEVGRVLRLYRAAFAHN